MGEKIIAWGKPNITLFGQQVDFNALTSLRCDENDIKEDGLIFCLPDELPMLSFDVNVAPETLRNLRKLFKRRIPRKRKKYVKTQISKRFGIKTKQIKFDYKVLNNEG